MDCENETIEIENFSHIKSEGIKKKFRPNLRAMKRPNIPSQSSSFFSKFTNPLKKDSGPQPKEIILKNNKHRYNPITKTYEFDDDGEKVVEEFLPPPKAFTHSNVTAKKKMYVDVIGQDIDLGNYKIAEDKEINNEKQNEKRNEGNEKLEEIFEITQENFLLDEKKSNEMNDIEENLFFSNDIKKEEEPNTIQKNPFPDSKEKYPSKGEITLQQKLNEKSKELERSFEKIAQMASFLENLQIPDYIYPEHFDFDNERINFSMVQLEKENLELNTNLAHKSLTILELHERIKQLENQNSELSKKVEWNENEKNGIFNNYHEENSKLVQELKNINEKFESKENILKNKIKELKNLVIDLQIKEKIMCQARAKSEINEKNSNIKFNQLEKDYNWAVGLIQNLQTRIKYLEINKFEMLSEEHNNNKKDITEFIETIQSSMRITATEEKLTQALKEKEDLENALLEDIEKKNKIISETSEKYKILIQKINDSNKEKIDAEINKLRLKHENEKSTILNEINILKQKNKEIQEKLMNYTEKEIESKLVIDKINSENEFLKNENLELLKNEEELYDKQILQKTFIEELETENQAYMKKIDENNRIMHQNQVKIQELEKKIEENQTIINQNQTKFEEFEKRIAEITSSSENTIKTLKLSYKEYEKQVSENLKKLQGSEGKYKNNISILESENNTLAEKIKLLEESIAEMELEKNNNQKFYEEEKNEIIKNYEEQITAKSQENSLLLQEITINNESAKAEISTLHNKVEQNRFIISKLELEVSENSEIRKKNDFLEQELEYKNNEIANLSSELNKSSQEISENYYKLQALIEENSNLFENKELKEIISDYEEKVEGLSQDLEKRIKEIERVEDLVQEKIVMIEEKNRILDSLKADKQNLESQNKRISSEYQQSLSINSELLEKNEDLSKLVVLNSEKISFLEENLKKMQETLESYSETSKFVDNLQSENQDLLSKYQQLQLENETLGVDLENFTEALKNQESEKNQLQEQIKEYEIKYEELQSEFNLLSDDNIKIYEDLNNTEFKLNQKIEEIKEIQDFYQNQIKELNTARSEEILKFNQKINQIEEGLKYEKNEKLHILREFNEIKLQKASAEKLSNDEKFMNQKNKEQYNNELEIFKNKNIYSQTVIESLEKRIFELETEIAESKKNAEINLPVFANLSNQFGSKLDFPENFENLQNEKWELESKIQNLIDEKLNYESQIESLTKENDSLYEKNYNLMQQNQLLKADHPKKSDPQTNFQLTIELEKKLKEKDEELELIKQNYKELIQELAENNKNKSQSSKPKQEEGWITSVIGSIFLTDKERQSL